MWYIKELKIENFKSFKDVKFFFNSKLNVLTGVNNAGKTTVLEAIALWYECAEKTIRTSKRASPYIERGYYFFGNSQDNYFPFQEIVRVRSPYFEDLFFERNTDNKISISVKLSNGEKNFVLEFIIKKASHSNYQIEHHRTGFDYEIFNKDFQLPNFGNIIYSNAISSVLEKEDYMYLPKVKNLIKARQSSQVIRNRISRLAKNPSAFEDFQLRLNQILFNISSAVNPNGLNLRIDSRENEDTRVKVNFTKDSAVSESKDLSLLGSGTLQIIEVLLSLYEGQTTLNLVLLDEPDSHLHRDLQKRLMDVLTVSEFASNTQIFVTTHNESLIRSTPPQNVFLLETESSNIYKSIGEDIVSLPKIGLLPSKSAKAIKLLDGESSLDFINALEANRILLIEGKSDSVFIEQLFSKDSSSSHVYWSVGSVVDIYKNIASYKVVFSKIKNGRNLWEKSILVFDRDYMPDFWKNEVQSKMSEYLGVPVLIWNSYTIESVIFSNIELLSQILAEININKETRQSEIAGEIEAALLNIIQEKQVKLDDRFVDEATKRIKQFLREINEGVINKKNGKLNLDSDIGLKSHFQDCYSLQKIHCIMDKDDVKKVLDSVTGSLNLIPVDDISDIWANMSSINMFEDCKALIQILR
ncbi:MAG: AAA15 family ATPase/GTPase [Flammeovirgaceae bacterium]|jgi:AAA15 family ATPase/GTPase